MAQSASDTKKTAKLVNKEQIKACNPENVFDWEDTKKTEKMINKEQIKATNPDDVLDWEVGKLEKALKELDITIGKSWSKAKKALELSKAITAMNAETKDDSAITGQDTKLMMYQMFKKFMEE